MSKFHLSFLFFVLDVFFSRKWPENPCLALGTIMSHISLNAHQYWKQYVMQMLVHIGHLYIQFHMPCCLSLQFITHVSVVRNNHSVAYHQRERTSVQCPHSLVFRCEIEVYNSLWLFYWGSALHCLLCCVPYTITSYRPI